MAVRELLKSRYRIYPISSMNLVLDTMSNKVEDQITSGNSDLQMRSQRDNLDLISQYIETYHEWFKEGNTKDAPPLA